MSSKLKWLLITLLLSSSAAWSAATPQEVVKATADSVIDDIESNRHILETDPEKIFEMVNELVIPRFDFISIAL